MIAKVAVIQNAFHWVDSIDDISIAALLYTESFLLIVARDAFSAVDWGATAADAVRVAFLADKVFVSKLMVGALSYADAIHVEEEILGASCAGHSVSCACFTVRIAFKAFLPELDVSSDWA